MLRVGLRYSANLMMMVGRHRGPLYSSLVGARFLATEATKLPRYAAFSLRTRIHHKPIEEHPRLCSGAIIAGLASLGIEMHEYHVDVESFWDHVAAYDYPRNYAAGPMSEGGAREEKLLEYFVTMNLLDIRPTDVVVDVASEWSVFPDMLRTFSGATLFRQDLIYEPGIHQDRIGGSAAHMPVPDGFADKLVLHNAFEHFEGTADIDFMAEAWRVLKPGGVLCILPLFMAERYSILSDPLVNRRGIVWDEGAHVVELPWWHNRFGRLYDAAALQRRVLSPGAGFRSAIYYLANVQDVHPGTCLHFGLIMRKPDISGPRHRECGASQAEREIVPRGVIEAGR